MVNKSDYSWLSREVFLLINNVLLLVAALSVLCGTPFPLAGGFAGRWASIQSARRISIAVFVPLMAGVADVYGRGPGVQLETQAVPLKFVQRLLPVLIASVVIGLIFLAHGGKFHTPGWCLLICLAAWVVATSIADRRTVRARFDVIRGPAQTDARLITACWWRISGRCRERSWCGALPPCTPRSAICASPSASTRKWRVTIFCSPAPSPRAVPIDVAQRGLVMVSKDGREIAELYPEKRRYNARRDQIGDRASIDAGLFRDIYMPLLG